MKYKSYISKYRSELKTMFWGIILIAGGLVFWWHLVGNPINELNLILSAKITDGYIIDSWEDVGEDDVGRSHWAHSYYYEYQLPDGRKFYGEERGDGRTIDMELPFPIEVEYLPDDPEVSRIKGSGSSDVLEWLWRKIGGGGFFLVMCLTPGFILIRAAIIDIKKIKSAIIP